MSHESNICGIQKTGLFAPLSRCHFQSNFLCILRARSASDTDPSNFLQVEKHARSTSERWREGRCCPPFRNWLRRSMLLERGDVGLPGTVRGHFKERGGRGPGRGGDILDILDGFPEPQDRILAPEAKSLRLMSSGQHFARSVQHMQL